MQKFVDKVAARLHISNSDESGSEYRSLCDDLKTEAGRLEEIKPLVECIDTATCKDHGAAELVAVGKRAADAGRIPCLDVVMALAVQRAGANMIAP